MDNIQRRVAENILQEPFKVELGDVSYMVESPTLATLILASEEIANMPKIEVRDGKSIVFDVLATAKDCASVGRVLAIFILGAKTIKEKRTSLISRLLRLVGVDAVKRELDRLTDRILINASLEELNVAYATLVQHIDIGDFFSVTTFLQGVNLTKPTRVV